MHRVERSVKQFVIVNVNIESNTGCSHALMTEQNDNINMVGDLPIMSHDPSFAPEEMVACGSCSRPNPPNRLTCLYCGSALESTAIRPELVKPNLQRPESWEKGSSIVFKGGVSSDIDAASAAALLDLAPEDLSKLLDSGVAVPIAYLRSRPDAEIVASRLADMGISSSVVSDDDLNAETSPRRIRSLEFTAEGLRLFDFNTSHRFEIAADERVMIVGGTIRSVRTEAVGKRSKRSTKNIDQTITSTDEAILDIYSRSEPVGFRVRAAGFDFSCLGERKQMLASVNMNTLARTLKEAFPASLLVECNRDLSIALDAVWPMETKTGPRAITRRAGVGVRMESVSSVDNILQFTKFSRLQRQFL